MIFAFSTENQQPAATDRGLPPILATAIDGIAHGGFLDLLRGNVIFTIGNAVRRLLLMPSRSPTPRPCACSFAARRDRCARSLRWGAWR